jgi:hypothetical protein
MSFGPIVWALYLLLMIGRKGQLVFDVMHKLHDYGYTKRRLEDHVQDALVL